MTRSRSRVLISTTLAFVLATTGVIAIFFATPAQAHSSTVTVLDGTVLVRHSGSSFAPIPDGEVVGGGDTVRTSAGSHGVLTFFDGTTVELEPDTEITIDTLQASASGDKIVQITQVLGRTWNVVTHLVSPSSRYEIRTTAATAAVRGTAFQVAVSPDGTTTTQTTEGDVATTAQSAEVHVLRGQISVVAPGSPPEAPQPAPEPRATIRITVDSTQNAIVTDANGRAVGLLNGLPIRYVPGSTVEVVGGKLVLTIPNVQLGVLSTFIRPDPAPFGGSTPASVTVQTEVVVKDLGVVANSLTTRPVENGTAKGAVVVTPSGLLLIPDGDARNAPGPHIGKPPAGPTGILPFFTAPTSAPLVTPAPTGGSGASTPGALDVTTAAFVPYGSTGAGTAPANSSVVPVTAIQPIFTVAGPTPTPTPAPLLRPLDPVFTIATPTPTPTPALILRTVDPIVTIATARPTPTPAPLLRTLDPVFIIATPTPTPLILRTLAPPIFIIATPSPTPTPSPALILRTLDPVLIIVAPTPTPTPAPVLRVIDPIFTLATPTPTPAPTRANFCTLLCN
ncbi:MAG: FecR family protein [Chloroflexota bacterium]|nr:FecR family protein [Chloroflexota bacterium]